MNRSRDARPRDQRGQVTTMLVIVVSATLLAVGLLGIVLIGRAVDDKTKAQTAADAAALAGAGVLSDALPNLVGLLNSLNDNLAAHVGCDLGRESAEEYAAKNGATLTDYCFDLASGRVSASVRMNAPVSDDVGPAEASAVASTGLDLSGCGFSDPQPPDETDDPEPTDEPTDGPPPPPPPPPDTTTSFDCGPLQVDFVIDGETGALHVSHVDLDGLEPSLVE
ncbi:pilus assembly protein TadG-related protein [Nocardioides sp. MH1]|uniref:pilus assembly protein TadG-related protein n=1 Tax=Nocardioides sp. MH1 TaxID=3242490 RepID=UPI003522022C